MTIRDDILTIAARRQGLPYALPPDPMGQGSIDCSLYVKLTYMDAGIAFAGGVRTAEQIRLACNSIEWSAVLPGDLLFFENTYEGADGRATHVGISLGAGTQRMWDAHEPGGVQLTDIGTDWWQEKLFEARRAPALAAPAQGEAHYTLAQVYPVIQALSGLYGANPQLVAAVAYQESSFVNWRVHRDGTGHGLFGLDDNGLLPAAERWAGGAWGRGAEAKIIPVSTQIEYAAQWFAKAVHDYGTEGSAAAVWHRGGLYADAQGQAYTQLIAAHVRTLFGG